MGAELFEAAKKVIAKELRNDAVIGRPIKVSQPYVYTTADVSQIAASARERLLTDVTSGKAHHLALLYVPHAKHDVLLDCFLPATLNIQLPTDLNSLQKEKAVAEVMKGVRHAQSLSAELNEIFESKIRKTALALPFVNYNVSKFQHRLKEISCVAHDQEAGAIDGLSDMPTLTTTNPKLTVFSDSRDLLFIPAKRREFHGFEVSADLPSLWLSGAFRIGRSIPVGFHYDVRPDRPPLNRFRFQDCEAGEVTPQREHTYINITPNDRTRLGKGS